MGISKDKSKTTLKMLTPHKLLKIFGIIISATEFGYGDAFFLQKDTHVIDS